MMKLPSDRGKTKAVIFTSLTDDEDKALDANLTITIERGNLKCTVSPNAVYAYGEIDFSMDSDDMLVLSDFNWFSFYQDHGFWMPANYDYKNHCCYSPTKKAQWFDTVCPEKVAQYIHGYIGKPKKTLIFKVILQ